MYSPCPTGNGKLLHIRPMQVQPQIERSGCRWMYPGHPGWSTMAHRWFTNPRFQIKTHFNAPTYMQCANGYHCAEQMIASYRFQTSDTTRGSGTYRWDGQTIYKQCPVFFHTTKVIALLYEVWDGELQYILNHPKLLVNLPPILRK